MSEHIPQNEYCEQDQITLALKKQAARLLAESRNEDGMVSHKRKKYVHTVRALQAHKVERERDYGLTDPFRSIYEFYLQEIGEWYGKGNPGPNKRVD